LLQKSFPGGTVSPDEARAECKIRLDDFGGEQRNSDLAILGKVSNKRLLISVEAKADESFGEVVGEYYGARLKLANLAGLMPRRTG
jgi:hypothetical protein